MQNCLGKNCPNHCCSNKFKGLSNALRNTDDSKFVQIQLSNEEVKEIMKKGKETLIENYGDKYFLKLNDDYSCSALNDGRCSIYEVRPDVCKLYPYYFDPFCGISIDKNCPGNFSLPLFDEEMYKILKNRIDLFSKKEHFFFDGYDIEEEFLMDIELMKKLLIEINTEFLKGRGQNILISYFDGKVKEDGGISGIVLGPDFHFTCHTFCYKNTVFIDCYGLNNCDNEILSIVNKYFKTENYDLCKNNKDKIGNFGKHIIIDINGKMDYESSKKMINLLFKELEMTPIHELITDYRTPSDFDIIQPIAESHISIHCKENKIILDVFSCKSFQENKIFELLPSNITNVYEVNRGIKYNLANYNSNSQKCLKKTKY